MSPTTTPSHAPARPPTVTPPQGVRGWLLVLCLMLTVVGPAIAIGLMVIEHTPAVSWVMNIASLLFGVCAGVQLWRLRPGAVVTAKRALLLGLAVDIVTALIQATTAQPASGPLLFQAELGLLPSAIFFTLCFAYLNHSRRVQATYG